MAMCTHQTACWLHPRPLWIQRPTPWCCRACQLQCRVVSSPGPPSQQAGPSIMHMQHNVAVLFACMHTLSFHKPNTGGALGA
jgi:hypothetical protein